MLIASANGSGFIVREGRRNCIPASVVKITVNWRDGRTLAGSERSVDASQGLRRAASGVQSARRPRVRGRSEGCRCWGWGMVAGVGEWRAKLERERELKNVQTRTADSPRGSSPLAPSTVSPKYPPPPLGAGPPCPLPSRPCFTLRVLVRASACADALTSVPVSALSV